MIYWREACIASIMLIICSVGASAQFVPVEGKDGEGSPAETPKLKMLKTIRSAPFTGPPSIAEETDSALDDEKSADDDKTQIGEDAWLAFSAFQRGQYITAMELALPRAQLGDPAAQTLIAELFAEGFGVGRSMDDAVFWYDQAAKNGDASAQYKLALLLTNGKYAEKDEKRARELMQKSAEGGNPKAQFNYAQLLVSERPGPKGIEDALPFFESAAARGIPDAQYALSQIYVNEIDVSEQKRALARRHLISAARAGYDTARLDLAIWLIDGVGGDRDFEAGFEWMRLAALKGNVIAQNRLAHLYIQAIGTVGNPIEAGRWYIVSRRAGLEDPSLEDFYQGLTADEQKRSLEAANLMRF
ncbi:tetratricopeptide repeat protein [Lentilitoribacter sp. EG35]|uniref:tetratricopeptide repeat protein n=1 Tax=Lentilitoribacter sp. EG35 TaxID=3234192 RepID=UPI0034602453